MLRGDRQRRRIGLGQSLETVGPDFPVVPLRAPGDAAGKALLEGRRTRRVIAAQANGHNTDALGIDLGPRCQIVEHRRRVVFGIVPQVEIAEADAFTVARAIDDQAGDAARGEIGDAFEILNLLGDIEAVEEHHRRHFATTISRLGMHVDRRQAGAVIGNFHVLHARPLDVFGRVAKAIDAALVSVVARFTLRLQEALADMIIGAGALQILRAAHRVARGNTLAAAILDGARLARPFAEPGIVVADAIFKPQPDAIDFADFRAAPWRHVQPDQQSVRPAVIVRKIRERQFFGGHWFVHSRSSHSLSGASLAASRSGRQCRIRVWT